MDNNIKVETSLQQPWFKSRPGPLLHVIHSLSFAFVVFLSLSLSLLLPLAWLDFYASFENSQANPTFFFQYKTV